MFLKDSVHIITTLKNVRFNIYEVFCSNEVFPCQDVLIQSQAVLIQVSQVSVDMSSVCLCVD